MNRAAAARPSGADAEPVGWELAAFEAAVHSDPIELAGAKRALKAFFFRLLPDIKVEDSFGEADQVLSTLMHEGPQHEGSSTGALLRCAALAELTHHLDLDLAKRSGGSRS